MRLLDGATATVVALRTLPGVGAMWDLSLGSVHTFAVGDAQVVVHNCGGAEDATPIVSGKPHDAHFETQEEAKAAALRAYNVSDTSTSTVDVKTMYGQNPTLLGPQGEPWEEIYAYDDNDELVKIEHHANGHYFEDNNTYALPHYHGPDGSHFFYGDRIW